MATGTVTSTCDVTSEVGSGTRKLMVVLALKPIASECCAGTLDK